MSILCYHAVDPRWSSRLSVPPELFERHCLWLARNRRVMPLDEVSLLVGPRGSLAGKRSAITFDDGFESLYTHAWPLLRRHRLPATIFLVAQTLAPEGKQVDWAAGPPGRALTTLDTEQILEMQAAGISFGSHSYAHRDLVDLSDEDCERDLRMSRDLLEELLGRPVRTLAYPRGLHDQRVHRATARAGFEFAFGTSKPVDPPGPLAIPRIGVYPNNQAMSLRLKSSRLYPPVRTSRAWPTRRSSGR